MKIIHFFTGHHYRIVSAKFNAPIYQTIYTPHTGDEEQAAWGFTHILMSCSCGKLSMRRLIGDHSSVTSAQELTDLERLWKK